jgi:uncharacterized membrane protein YhaH (DUF805 family)
MGLTWLFLSFQGRINRAVWWAVIAGTAFLDVGLYLLTSNWEDPTFSLIAGLVILAMRLAPGVKRLHDRNKSGTWLWLYYGVPQLALVLATVTPVGDPSTALLAMVSLGVLIWAIIDLGIQPGTPGDNQYGPDPLAGRRPGGPVT